MRLSTFRINLCLLLCVQLLKYYKIFSYCLYSKTLVYIKLSVVSPVTTAAACIQWGLLVQSCIFFLVLRFFSVFSVTTHKSERELVSNHCLGRVAKLVLYRNVGFQLTALSEQRIHVSAGRGQPLVCLHKPCTSIAV